MEKWEIVLEKFLKKWKDKKEVIGAIVCGSFITGNPSKHSDIDIHILLNSKTTWRERGNEIIDGILIEYFANPIKKHYEYNNEDYKQRRKINAGKLKLNIKTKIGDMLCLPYKDNSFDCLLAFHTIYHTDYNGLKKIISEISRVLKKNGEAFITLISKQSDSYKNEINNKIDDFTIIKTEGCEIEVPHTYLNYENVIELLNKFNILKLQHIEDYWEGRRHAHYFILFKK